jgi:hypothetical protein
MSKQVLDLDDIPDAEAFMRHPLVQRGLRHAVQDILELLTPDDPRQWNVTTEVVPTDEDGVFLGITAWRHGDAEPVRMALHTDAVDSFLSMGMAELAVDDMAWLAQAALLDYMIYLRCSSSCKEQAVADKATEAPAPVDDELSRRLLDELRGKIVSAVLHLAGQKQTLAIAAEMKKLADAVVNKFAADHPEVVIDIAYTNKRAGIPTAPPSEVPPTVPPAAPSGGTKDPEAEGTSPG